MAGTIDEMIDTLFEEYGFSIPFPELFLSEPYQKMTEKIVTARYLGLDQVGKWRCHQLAFVQNMFDWQIWVEDGDAPLPRKLIITYKQERAQPQFRMVFHKWNLTPYLTDYLFQFVPPRGSRRVEMLSLDAGR